MNRTSKQFLALCLLGLATFFSAYGQRTGDIVEIFGRDKVETTDEGIIVHEFMEGLALRNAIRPELLMGSQDILFWQIATNQFQKPILGVTLAHNYNSPGETQSLRWESINADTAGIFSDDLGRAYVYTEFNSPEERIALLDASGHTRVFINGQPHEGDHYDFRHTLIPFKLLKGENLFVYTYGRFGRVASKIVIPNNELLFSQRDMTLPSIITGEKNTTWGAIRVINATEQYQNGLTIECILETGERTTNQADGIMPLTTRKLKYKIPALLKKFKKDKISATLILRDELGKEVDRTQIPINVKDGKKHHERTFVSNIDGSVQYYSVAPSTSNAPNQSLVLSVHGASVEATNQTRAYKQKDWAHIIAPTNRRPFGFNWEEWGRIDALEVLDEAKKIYQTDNQKTYLTGHSMGGHGTWFLGATYPDKWAAIAPAAGYPDIIGYRRDGVDSAMFVNPHFEMFYRGALAGRVIDIKRNYLQSGVYVLHGGADRVVPVEQARLMREELGKFHDNFAYYEYPGGSHWYGDHSMDWPPLFDFLKQNQIPLARDVKKIEFHTASPGVSASNYWITINQQESSYTHSTANLELKNDTIIANLKNIASITLHLGMLDLKTTPTIVIEDQYFKPTALDDLVLMSNNGIWSVNGSLDLSQKHPARYGGFKLAFTNNVVLVYATNGTDDENAWHMNKARFDAETFLYRGNGSFDVIPDDDFSPERFADRNVIIYGNSNNNSAWKKLLNHCPVQVTSNSIVFGDKVISGDDLGTYFIYSRADSQNASVGVVAATGELGMKGLYPNDYFSGITGFPDLLIFTVDWLKEGLDGVKVSGFFGNDWSIENGEFSEN
jgi:predicted peptidase